MTGTPIVSECLCVCAVRTVKEEGAVTSIEMYTEWVVLKQRCLLSSLATSMALLAVKKSPHPLHQPLDTIASSSSANILQLCKAAPPRIVVGNEAHAPTSRVTTHIFQGSRNAPTVRCMPLRLRRGAVRIYPLVVDMKLSFPRS